MESHITHRFIEVNGVRLHLAEAGEPSQPLLLLLHGFPEFWYSWKNQIEFFAQQGFHVIAPDQRGYHLSDKPRGICQYNLDVLAKDIISILDHEQVAQAYLVGHDWGAGAAYWAALRYPQRFYKLAILQLPHLVAMQAYLKTNPEARKKASYLYFFQLPFLPEYMLGRNNYRRLRHALTKFSRKNTFSEADLAEYQAAWQQKRALTGMLNWYRASFRCPPKIPDDVSIHLPTLVLWGEKDFFFDKEVMEVSRQYLPQAEIIYFPEATHWIHHEYPDEVNQKLMSFLVK
ncbi:MAG: alpha/beta hydrolase [Microscillaceae bacterium]|jgi:pimeloyl-ACP methyl ester carboxylesterase|nr:alpha/beta hydrolase [Microscillaceae bacterium]